MLLTDSNSYGLSDTLAIYMKETGKYRKLSDEEEIEYGRLWKDEGDEEAREALITHNLRYVVKLAFSCSSEWGIPRTEIPDMIQAGNEGLIESVKRYDYRKKRRLAHYASSLIKRFISDFVRDNKGSFLIKRGTQREIHNINIARKYLSLAGRLDDDTLSELTGLSPYTIKVRDEIAGYREFSINCMNGDGGNGNGKKPSEKNKEIGRELVDDALLPDSFFDEEDLEKDTAEILGMVDEKQRHILIEHLFGGRTLKDIGENDFGQSRANASKIKIKAINRVKKRLERDPDMMERLLDYSWELANNRRFPISWSYDSKR